MKHVGLNIKRLRLKMGWRQVDIATKLGITVGAYSKVEAGLTDINLSRLFEISDIFKVEVLEILTPGNQYTPMCDMQELVSCQTKLYASEQKVLRLQEKVISLFEEVRQTN